MAKLVYGPIVSDARNKIGGVVFSRSRSGPYSRSKVSPTQPRTSYQSTVRANFTSLAKLWGDTTMDANRAGWISLAARYPVKDAFGNSRTLTGLQMFVRCNGALLAIAESVILPAPANLIAGTPGAVILTAIAPNANLTLEVAVNPGADEVPVIYAAAPASAGRSRSGAGCRQIKFFAAATAGPYLFMDEYDTKFGPWTVGARIFAEIRYVNSTTGAQGGKSTQNAIST